MENCNPKYIPITKEQSESQTILPDNKKYLQAIGSLIYLSTVSRPDISYAVINLARKSSRPTKEDWRKVKHIMAYLKATVKTGLIFTKSQSHKLKAFSDSDYAGDVESGKSTSGTLILHGNNLIYWKSALQPRVSLSSFEAEYYALTNTAKDVLYNLQFLQEIPLPTLLPITINVDNQSAITVAESPPDKFNAKSKHINTKFHFIKDEIKNGTLHLNHVPTNENLADILTKALPRPLFSTLASALTGG